MLAGASLERWGKIRAEYSQLKFTEAILATVQESV